MKTRPLRATVLANMFAAALVTSVAGCASYDAKPLQDEPTALHMDAARVARLQIDPDRLDLPPLHAHRFDPASGFDPVDVAMLAVVNNPDLRLARDDAHIAHAQAFAAHLLPDPQIALSAGLPTPGVDGNNITAYSYGVNYDLIALLTHRISEAAANANARQSDLSMLWQEWQTALHAQQLFFRVRRDRAILPLLAQQQSLTAERLTTYRRAAVQGGMTDDLLTGALTTWQDAQKQYADARRAANLDQHDFNLLLGLAPDVALPLIDRASPSSDNSRRNNANSGKNGSESGGESSNQQDQSCIAVPVDAALTSMPKRRADLLALRAGYDSEDAKVRLQIWQQFPSFSIGIARASDNSAYKNLNLQVGFNLPIFNRNRGNIAIERATRQRLYDDYQNRINAAYTDVAQANADCMVMLQQRELVDAALPNTLQAAQEASNAYAAHNLTIGLYTDAMLTALTRHIDDLNLHEALAEQRLTLTALLGLPLDDTTRVPNAQMNDPVRIPDSLAALSAAK